MSTGVKSKFKIFFDRINEQLGLLKDCIFIFIINNAVNIVMSLWAITFLFGLIGQSAFSYDARGTFGDMFGMVNSLTSLVVYIYVKRGYDNQLKEIDLLKLQKSTEDNIREIEKLDRIYLNYFSLIKDELISTKIYKIEPRNSDNLESDEDYNSRFVVFKPDLGSFNLAGPQIKEFSGREAFYAYSEYLLSEIHSTLDIVKKNSKIDAIKNYIDKNNEDFLVIFGPYLRLYFHALNTLNIADVEMEIKENYAKILRAKTSNYELNILFFYAITSDAENNFRPLFRKYDIFRNIVGRKELSEKYSYCFAPTEQSNIDF